MKKFPLSVFTYNLLLRVSFLQILSVIFLTPLSFSQTICNNQTGTHGGFTYEYWKSTGTGCMTLKPGGGFSIEWKNVGNLLARKSTRPGSLNQVIEYDVDFRPTPNTGKSFVSIYGWTQNPLIEYYVVEAWSDTRPTKGTPLGTITTDGSQYDLYRTERVNKPSIEGTKTFYQYWSIRRTERTKGTVTMANHFQGWKDAGLRLGTLWEVSLVIEALRESAGFADVRSMSMTVGTGNNNDIIKGPLGYTFSVNENATVSISTTPMDIAYGNDGKYVYLTNQTKNVSCSNAAFGSDPFPGVQKYCFVKPAKITALSDEESLTLSVYPNPISELFTIFNLPDGASWKLLNSLGQEIMAGQETLVNAQSLEKGIYFLEISSGQKVKMIK